MAKFVITFVRESSFCVEVEATDEDEARRMFLNSETDGEQVIELIEDKIVCVLPVGAVVEGAPRTRDELGLSKDDLRDLASRIRKDNKG